MKCGDQNTGYFHQVTQSNASRNAIRRLTTATGAVLTEPEEIKAEAAGHFPDFLQQEAHDFNEVPQNYLSNMLSYRCTQEQREKLVTNFTGAEICKALSSLPSGKASGPDVFTKEFYISA